jgi:subtilase family serine protease
MSKVHSSVAALAAVAVLFASPSYAGRMRPHAIPAGVAQASPDAKARFTCELRPFDLSKGLFCYGPAAMRAAYGVDKLIAAGATGAGQTIVIIDAFGSPFVADDLKRFDAVYGLPDPNFSVVTMPGTPPYDPNNDDIVGWTGEIALDTQWAHAMAPAANIILVAAKSDYDNDLMDALNYALDHLNPTVVSMSFGESELNLANPAGLDIVKGWNAAFAKARRQRVTLFVSSGDQGVNTQDVGVGTPLGGTPNVGWPASSALVTSVGGTNLFFGSATNADPNGSYQGEQVWNDGYGASGGGMSILTAEPNFQKMLPKSIQGTLHGYRGVPDLSLNAGVVGGVIVAWSAPYGPGYFFLFGGTSAGAPEWAGIVADVDQKRGRPVGYINRKLYSLGAVGLLAPLTHDVTVGDNGFDSLPGYPALTGYDLSTGWGTANVGGLAWFLSCMSGDDDGSDP